MSSEVRITERRLTPAEAKLISEEIRLVPGITGYLPDQLLGLSNTFVVARDKDVIGMLSYVDAGKYVDLKLLFVRSQFREQGYSRRLFDTFAERFQHISKPIYAVTKNVAVVHMLREAGYQHISYICLPLACKLHQLKMVFDLYRALEYVRKLAVFAGSGPFEYWIKWPQQ